MDHGVWLSFSRKDLLPEEIFGYFCKTALEDSNSSFFSVDICCLIILSLINFAEYRYAFTTNI